MRDKRLKKYQHEAIDFMVERKYAMNADDPGLGKTAVSVVAMDEVRDGKLPDVILCPASVREQWVKEIDNWSSQLLIGQILYTEKDVIDPLADYYVIGYKGIDFILNNVEKINTLVIDEAHYCKSIESARTVKALGKSGLAGRSNRVWSLTGTPIDNRPVDLYPFCLTMVPQAIKGVETVEAFAIKYNGAYYDRWGSFKLGRAKNKEELKGHLKDFMIRRLKENVLDELPELRVNIEPMTVGENTLKYLNEKYEATRKNNGIKRDKKGDLVKLRQLCSNAKLEHTIEYIKKELETHQKIVLFTYHRELSQELRMRLMEYNPVIFFGGLSHKEKSETKNIFKQKKECRIFIGQIKSAGTGVDGLQYVCNRGMFVEWDWTPGAVTQAMDRLHRLGQNKIVNITFLAIPNSFESAMLKSVSRKSKDAKGILD